MAFRLYLVPVVGTGTRADPRRPKYFADGTVTGGWGGADYGFEPWMVVGADLSTADNATIAGQADTLVLPANLDGLLTAGNVTTVQTKLEAIFVPADWVTTAQTWRQVVRIVLGMFGLLQRFHGIHGNVRLFGSGITLETTFSQLSQTVRDELQLTASSLGVSTAGIVGATSIRQAWKILSDQMQDRGVVINGVAI